MFLVRQCIETGSALTDDAKLSSRAQSASHCYCQCHS